MTLPQDTAFCFSYVVDKIYVIRSQSVHWCDLECCARWRGAGSGCCASYARLILSLCRQSLVSAGAVSTVIMIIRDMLEDDIEVAIKVNIK